MAIEKIVNKRILELYSEMEKAQIAGDSAHWQTLSDEYYSILEDVNKYHIPLSKEVQCRK